MVYSSISITSLLISNVGTSPAVILAYQQHMESILSTPAMYTSYWFIMAISGQTGQSIQLSYLLRSTYTQEKNISRTLNGVYSSLTVAVRMTSHSLLTFHCTTGTSLIAHGSVRRTNDYLYITFSTMAGSLSTLLYITQ